MDNQWQDLRVRDYRLKEDICVKRQIHILSLSKSGDYKFVCFYTIPDDNKMHTCAITVKSYQQLIID